MCHLCQKLIILLALKGLSKFFGNLILNNKAEKILAEVDEFSLKLVDLLGTKKSQASATVVPINKAA